MAIALYRSMRLSPGRAAAGARPAPGPTAAATLRRGSTAPRSAVQFDEQFMSVLQKSLEREEQRVRAEQILKILRRTGQLGNVSFAVRLRLLNH